jgi:predicted HAD superfamily hydrolase
MITAKLHSFDIFDTLLTRDVGLPHNIFIILGFQSQDILPPEIDSVSFKDARVSAEFNAINQKEGLDPTLHEIYEQLASDLSLNHEAKTTLMHRELELESRHLLPIASGVATMNALREIGEKIAFVSDMYLPKPWIKEQLCRHGIYKEGDLLLVSSEDGASKHQGELYKKLKEQSGVSGMHIRHHGDNKRTDILKAVKNGIFPVFLTCGRFNSSESILATQATETAGLSGLFAGVSRMERNAAIQFTGQKYGLALTVSSTIAPVLCTFVLSILNRAEKDGCKRLYFFSRDGYILQRIAAQMCAALELKIECKYLYGSRLCWELAAIKEINESAINHIVQAHTKSSLSEIALRVDLSVDSLCKLIGDQNFRPENANKPLSRGQTTALVNHLKTNEVLRAEICKQSAEARQLTRQYLSQEGVQGTDWAFVDVGWQGTLQKSYMQFAEAENTPITSQGYYFGSLQNSNTAEVTKYGWMFEPNDEYGLDTKLELLTIIESFCSAPHGSLAKYQLDKESQQVVPVLRTANTDALDAFGMPFVCEQIFAYNQHLCTMLPNFNYRKNLQPCVRELLLRFLEKPTIVEAEAWGQIPFEGVPTDSGYETIAGPVKLSVSGILESIRYGRVPSQNYSKWAAASLRLTPLVSRALYTLAMKPALLARHSRRLINLSRKLRTLQQG